MKRDNNFNFLRLLGACLVISGHMGVLMGGAPTLMFNEGEHILGVSIFFLIGGYLIAKSWKRDPHPGRYALKRILRVIPEYYVCLLVTVIVCSFFSTADPQTYWAGARVYVLHNMRFYTWIALPGVFEHNPVPNNVNGAIWTLPMEMLMYLISPFYLELLKKIRNPKIRKSTALVITACIAGINFVPGFHSHTMAVYGTDWIQAASDIPYWFIGILMEELEVEKHTNVPLAITFLMILNLFHLTFYPENILLYVIWPYFIFSIGCNDLFKKVGSHLEISYGMYLYGFVIEQIVVYIMERSSHLLSLNRSILICIVLSGIAGTLSSLCISKPVKYLQHKIMKTK